MNKYELVYILDAHLAQDAKEDINKQVVELISKAEGKVINSSVWLERQRIFFPINKIQDGTYYLVNLEGPATASVKLRQFLKLNEKVLRFLLINVNVQKVVREKKNKAKPKVLPAQV